MSGELVLSSLFVSPGKRESFNIDGVIIFSSSFGGLIASLALKKYPFESVRKCFFVSPLWDIPTYKLEETQNIQVSETSRLVDFSYPHSYRFKDKEDFFRKLKGALNVDGMNEKFLDETKEFHIFSGKQDTVTPLAMAEALAASHASSHLYALNGGHSSRIDIEKFKEILIHVCSDRLG